MRTLLLSLTAALAPLAPAPAQEARGSDLVAIRVGRAETVANGTIEHAVILVEGGKIVAIGQDLPVERGIRVVDRPEWVAMPGLVNPYSRMGLESRGGAGFDPQVSSAAELYPLDPQYGDLLEAGVTTLGLYPAGTGVPGQAIAVRPSGDSREAMLLSPSSYLLVWFRSDARSKKQVRDAFEKVDEYLEKEKKAREKWDKDQEKAKKDADKKKDDKKDEKKGDGEKADEEKPDAKEEPAAYVPPEPDEKVVPFLALRNGEARALAAISSAGDYLHWLDAIGEEEFQWDLRVPVVRELDLYEVKDKIGEKGCRVLMEPQLSLHPGTMRQRNLPAELAKAGAKLVLIPREDDVQRHRSWLRDVGEMIATGLDRDVALRALTLEPAGLLGLQERLGSLEVGKDANLIFLDGDPFETTTKLEAVMLEGRFVKGEVQQ
jgi:hypothetical protein